MAIRIPREIREAMAAIARKTGSIGGKTAAKNMSPEQRSARAKKASEAAARKRTEKRLAAEAKTKPVSKSKTK
jgi:hypothetical protein